MSFFSCFWYQLTNAVENVARVLHCAARTNLTITEATVMRLIMEMTERLSSLIQQLSTAVSVHLLLFPHS